MTAPVIDAGPLTTAIKTAVTAQGITYVEARKPATVGTKPYIVAFFDSGTIGNRSLRSRDGWSMVGSFQCAGLSPEATRGALRALRTALLGLRGQAFDGRTLQMPEHLPALPMDRDDDADPVLFIQIDEWKFRLS